MKPANLPHRELELEPKVPVAEPAPLPTGEKKLTGGSSSYYTLFIAHPTDPSREPYTVECNDIIEALGMSFAEGNVFKANWRRAAERQGNGKPGTTGLYDAEKMVFFSEREVIKEKNNAYR